MGLCELYWKMENSFGHLENYLARWFKIWILLLGEGFVAKNTLLPNSICTSSLSYYYRFYEYHCYCWYDFYIHIYSWGKPLPLHVSLYPSLSHQHFSLLIDFIIISFDSMSIHSVIWVLFVVAGYCAQQMVHSMAIKQINWWYSPKHEPKKKRSLVFGECHSEY